MSLAEFCYSMFQAYDWWAMYQDQAIQVQIGGSDQYGNICAGIDVVNSMRAPCADAEENLHAAPFGVTTPLLISSSGEKFGKSAGNALWLDPDMFSSFDLYQVCASSC